MRHSVPVKLIRRKLTMWFPMVMVVTLLVAMLPMPRALSVIQQPTVAKAAAVGSVKLGNYIQFGKYNGAPILWRVINVDASGNPVLLANRILTLKAFDSRGVIIQGSVTE